MHFSSLYFIVGGLLASLTASLPSSYTTYDARAAEETVETAREAPLANQTFGIKDSDRYVFCHFMMGIVPNRASSADYDDDMKRAKAAGIDAFALNIGTDDYTRKQLSFAYESAANNDMKVFISFDFSRFSPSDPAAVAALIKEFGDKAGQLKVDDKVFVSTFIGDALNVGALRAALPDMPIYFVPNFNPNATPDPQALDGAFNWMGWNHDGNNRAPKPGKIVTVKDGDDAYKNWLGAKDYMAPVSPWFFTHYGPETYNKNFVFPGDLVWFQRWNGILASPPRFLEIQTWNDYGESHYVGPLSSIHTDDGNSKWVNDMPHNGWLDMAKPFIAAYKASASSVGPSFIDDDQLIYWYRPTKKTVTCATDNTMGPPDGYETFEDSVFVVSLLKEAGTVSVSSGDNTKSFEAPAGASAWKLDMGVGKQKFELNRGGQAVLEATSLRDISGDCPCGIYNFNAYVGTVPTGDSDALRPDALAAC